MISLFITPLLQSYHPVTFINLKMQYLFQAFSINKLHQYESYQVYCVNRLNYGIFLIKVEFNWRR